MITFLYYMLIDHWLVFVAAVLACSPQLLDSTPKKMIETEKNDLNSPCADHHDDAIHSRRSAVQAGQIVLLIVD